MSRDPEIHGIRRSLRVPRRVEHEVNDEIAFHIESRVRELTERGIPADQAREIAEREFGDVAASRPGTLRMAMRPPANNHPPSTYIMKSSYLLSVATIASLVGPALFAQDAKKPPPTELNVDFGVVDVTGNTSTSSINANARYIRRIDKWEFKEDLGEVYGKTAGVESSNLLRLGTRADYAVATHVAVYGLGAYDRNRFAGIRSRYAEGAGGVWKVVATDGDQFNVEGGYQYTQQKNLVGPDHNFSALRLASDWKHSFTKASYFYQAVEYVPDLEDSQDYRINSETGVVAPVSAHIGIKFSYVVRFANEPPLNAAGTALLRKTDRILSAGVQVSY